MKRQKEFELKIKISKGIIKIILLIIHIILIYLFTIRILLSSYELFFFPSFIAAYSASSHTLNEKRFTQRVFLAKKVKNISVME